MNRCLALTVLFALSLSACTAMSNITASSSKRQEMLRTSVNQLHRLSDRGQVTEALEIVNPESRSAFVDKQEADKKGKERVIEKTIETVDFNDDSDQATVHVAVRYFRKPHMVVMERKEEEQWSYSATEGWLWDKAERSGAADADQPATLNGTL